MKKITLSFTIGLGREEDKGKTFLPEKQLEKALDEEISRQKEKKQFLLDSLEQELIDFDKFLNDFIVREQLKDTRKKESKLKEGTLDKATLKDALAIAKNGEPKRCVICNDILPSGTRKYCSPKCRKAGLAKLAHKYYRNRVKRLTNGNGTNK
jgi:predicted nucleic acid-binding Zn ribbon protein